MEGLAEFKKFINLDIKNNGLARNFVRPKSISGKTKNGQLKLSMLIDFMEYGVKVIIENGDIVPEHIINSAYSYVKEFNSIFEQKAPIDKSSVFISKFYHKRLNFITDFYEKNIENHSTKLDIDVSNFYHTFHYLRLWKVEKVSISEEEQEVIKKIINKKWNDEIPDIESIIENEIKKKSATFEEVYIKAVEDGKSISKLTSLLQRESKKVINKSYAEKFRKQATEYRNASLIWLTIGVISITVFFILIFKTEFYSTISTHYIDKGAAVYNLTNIILEIAVISLQVFFISFTFKQFSVNRHLSTINKHRANAFDSYEFFANAMKEDPEGQKTLMLQLAKAIYEQTTTGYLGSKDNVNPSLLEITNLIKSTTGS